MIEPAMYGAIGFLIAMLLALMLMPPVHNRAVRLTRRRLEAATPLSLAEIQADKDQMRAQFAMETRRLELTIEQLRNQAVSQAADLGKKTDAFNRMRMEIEEKNAALAAWERGAGGELKSAAAAELRAAELALARRQVDAAGASEAMGDVAAESRRAELTAAHARADALTRRVGELKEALAAKQAEIGERESVAESLRQSLDEARRNFDALKAETTAKAKRSALGKARAEKAAAEQQLQEAREALSRTERELTELRAAAQAARAAERAESALLRERIQEVAAEVAKLALTMEGPGGAIGALLAADGSDATDRPAAEGGSGMASLASRIRALQTRVERPTLSA